MAKKTSKGNDVASKLSALGKAWKGSSPRKPGAPLPPGEYIFRVDQAVIGLSKAGNLQVVWDLTVMDGDLEGKKTKRFTSLENEESLSYMQGDLETLEVTVPDSVDDLGDALTECAGLFVAGVAVKNDEYLNIYFNEAVEATDDGEDGGEEEEAEEGEEEEAEDGDEDSDIVWEKGDRVLVDIDGETYAGEIKKVGEETAQVVFDDGDKMDIDLGDLSPEEEDEE